MALTGLRNIIPNASKAQHDKKPEHGSLGSKANIRPSLNDWVGLLTITATKKAVLYAE